MYKIQYFALFFERSNQKKNSSRVVPFEFALFRFVSIELKSAKKSPFATRNSSCNFKEEKPRFRSLYEGCVTSGHLAGDPPSIPSL